MTHQRETVLSVLSCLCYSVCESTRANPTHYVTKYCSARPQTNEIILLILKTNCMEAVLLKTGRGTKVTHDYENPDPAD